jgi:hypothetical protein
MAVRPSLERPARSFERSKRVKVMPILMHMLCLQVLTCSGDERSGFPPRGSALVAPKNRSLSFFSFGRVLYGGSDICTHR